MRTIAIVGRPNVGKSTFFNRVVGGREAIVDSEPGVTRDLKVAQADWAGRTFFVVDTGGILEETAGEIEAAVRQQALAAIENADAIVFMVDGQQGVHPLDEHIAQLLRERSVPTLLVVNKLDQLPETTDHMEFYALGLGEPHPLSAASGKGSGDVLDRVVELLPEVGDEGELDAALRLAVIGRPNVGKSSYINRVLGTERLVVAEEAGTTRDSIDTWFDYGEESLVFVDTAGLRKRSRVEEGLEYYATLRTHRAIERADVCILLVDSVQGAANQDFRIARLAWDKGCGLVMAANKWDLVEKDDQTASRYQAALRERMPFLRWVPIVFISALTGQRVLQALDAALEVGREREKRIPTSEFNRVLDDLADAVQPPQKRGRPVKLYYGTQPATRPPTFVIWTNYPRDIPKHYVRYLANGFREAWGFSGTPIRIRFRSRKRKRAG